MNNIIVYAETDSGKICDVSLELLTKARTLAERLGVDVEALLIGSNVERLAPQLKVPSVLLLRSSNFPGPSAHTMTGLPSLSAPMAILGARSFS